MNTCRQLNVATGTVVCELQMSAVTEEAVIQVDDKIAVGGPCPIDIWWVPGLIYRESQNWSDDYEQIEGAICIARNMNGHQANDVAEQIVKVLRACGVDASLEILSDL